MNNTQAMKQALEALEELNYSNTTQVAREIFDAANVSLRQAIEQAAQTVSEPTHKQSLSVPANKPVAWMDEYGDVLSAAVIGGTGLRNIPLYTHPSADSQDARRMDWLESSKTLHAFCATEYGEFSYYAFQIEGYKTVRETIDDAMNGGEKA